MAGRQVKRRTFQPSGRIGQLPARPSNCLPGLPLMTPYGSRLQEPLNVRPTADKARRNPNHRRHRCNMADPKGKTETVQVAPVPVQETSAAVRFVAVTNASGNDKLPKFRAIISLTGYFAGLVLEAAIFQSKDKGGQYEFLLPGGGRFPALKAENEVVTMPDGRVLVLASTSEKGQKLIDNLPTAIRTAFYAYQQTGNPYQRLGS